MFKFNLVNEQLKSKFDKIFQIFQLIIMMKISQILNTLNIKNGENSTIFLFLFNSNQNNSILIENKLVLLVF